MRSGVGPGECHGRIGGCRVPLERPVDRRAPFAEQFHQLGNRVVSGSVERHYMALLHGGELGLSPPELAPHLRHGHARARARSGQVRQELSNRFCPDQVIGAGMADVVVDGVRRRVASLWAPSESIPGALPVLPVPLGHVWLLIEGSVLTDPRGHH